MKADLTTPNPAACGFAKPEEHEAFSIGGQGRARADLEQMQSPLFPPNRPDISMRELGAWRSDTIGAMRAAVERDCFPPKHSKLIGGPLIDARAPGQKDWAVVGASGVVSLALLGAAVAHGVVTNDWTAALEIPAGIYLGYNLAGVIGPGVHGYGDEYWNRPHTPGQPSNLGVDGWIHHFIPKSVAGTHWAVTYNPAALASTALGAVALATDAVLAWNGNTTGIGSLLASTFASLTLALPLWLVGHRATHLQTTPGWGTRLLRAAEVADRPERHRVHHWGDLQNAKAAEPGVRHAEAFHTGFGKLSIGHWLDRYGLFGKAIRGARHVNGTEPNSFREYPHWKPYWTAAKADKPRAELQARIDGYAAEHAILAQDLEVADRSAQSPVPAEAAEAAQYAETLRKRMQRMTDGMAELEREKSALAA